MPLLATFVREHDAHMVAVRLLGITERSSLMNATIARREYLANVGTIDHRGVSVSMWADGIVHTLTRGIHALTALGARRTTDLHGRTSIEVRRICTELTARR
jgi:hypothetical protein